MVYIYKLPALEILVFIVCMSFTSNNVLLKDLGSFPLMKSCAIDNFVELYDP